MLKKYTVTNTFFTKKNSCIILILIFSINVFGQSKIDFDYPEKTTWQLFKYDIGSIFNGIGYSYARPLQWKEKQWVTFGSALSGAGVLFFFDEEASEFAIRQRP